MTGKDFNASSQHNGNPLSRGGGGGPLVDSDKVRQNLRLLFFGHLPDVTGLSETSWSADSGLTVAGLLEQIHTRWPALKAHDSSIRVAVNLEYADRSDTIPAGAEVAIMPPVQGG